MTKPPRTDPPTEPPTEPQTEQSDDHESEHEKRGWTARLARHRTGLAALSAAESTVVPIPLEAVVAPLMVGHPRRSISIAIAIWIGCLIGAGAFFWVGYFLADPVVIPALEALGLRQGFEDIADRLREDNLFWSVFLISFSPAPMQLATLGAGTIQGNFLLFMSAIALSRGIRYFGLALIAQFLGERIAQWRIPKRYLVPGLFAVLLAVWGVFQII